MPTTLRNTDILFNDGSTQSTAATGVPSSFSAVGSVFPAFNASTSAVNINGTIAGSSLIYPTNILAYVFYASIRTEGPGTGALPQSSFSYNNYYATRVTGSNSGFAISGGTALTGTWRNVGIPVQARTYMFEPTYGTSRSEAFMSFWIRIA
jgi:hypothetical protein